MSISIKYGNLTSLDISPYQVNSFDWNATTKDVIATVTISSHYIHSDTDVIEYVWLGKYARDPNHNYYMPKNRFSRHPKGGIYADYEKYGRNTSTQQTTTQPDPFQWEFDRQAYNDDLFDSDKSLNAQVWISVDSSILSISRDNDRKNDHKRSVTVTTMPDGTVWYVPT